MSTVLQKAIDIFKQMALAKGDSTYLEASEICKSLLHEEEKQIREAWTAAKDHAYTEEYGVVPNPKPDLETYITNLKK